MTPSSTSSRDAIDGLSILLGLIQQRNWNQFEADALSNPRTFQAISKFISEECDEQLGGMTLLHAVARYNPPLGLLVQMIRLYPSALTGQDCLGRTPLHVATGSGASPDAIKLLAINYPKACDIQDEDGRTPLHFACDTSCELFEDDDRSLPRELPCYETIRCLLSGSIDAVTIEDEDEMNAIEYAIVSDASQEVVRLLQKAAQRVMKQTSKACSSQQQRSTAFPTNSMARIRMH